MGKRAGLILLASAMLPSVAHAQAQTEKDRCVAAFEGGQLAQKAGKPQEARALFETCAQTCPAQLASDCRRWLVESYDASTVAAPSHSASAAPPPATSPPPSTSAAVHAPPSAPPAPPISDGGEPSTARPSEPDRTPHYVLGGIGLATILTGAAFAIKGTVDRDHFRDTCAPNCTQSDVTSVQTYWVTGSVMMGLGALSLGAALILWPRSPARVTAGFSPSPRSMEWLLRFEL